MQQATDTVGVQPYRLRSLVCTPVGGELLAGERGQFPITSEADRSQIAVSPAFSGDPDGHHLGLSRLEGYQGAELAAGLRVPLSGRGLSWALAPIGAAEGW